MDCSPCERLVVHNCTQNNKCFTCSGDTCKAGDRRRSLTDAISTTATAATPLLLPVCDVPPAQRFFLEAGNCCMTEIRAYTTQPLHSLNEATNIEACRRTCEDTSGCTAFEVKRHFWQNNLQHTTCQNHFSVVVGTSNKINCKTNRCFRVAPCGSMPLTGASCTAQNMSCSAGSFFGRKAITRARRVETQSKHTCTACGKGTFKTSAIYDATSCRAKRTSCPAGFALIPNDSLVMDHTCDPCSETFYATGPSDRPFCDAKTMECSAGSYLTATDTTQDNTCTSCGANEYKEGSTVATACKPKTMECAAGSYFTATDKTQDNTCTGCGNSEYKEGLNAETACQPKTTTECAAGSYFTATDKTQDNTCNSCGANTYKEASDAATVCKPKTLECAAGLYFTATDSKTQDNWCSSCGANTYTEAGNTDTTCSLKTLACGAGLYFTATDKKQDNACTKCGDNDYKEGSNAATACKPKTMECVEGLYFTATDKTQDNTCTHCAPTPKPGTTCECAASKGTNACWLKADKSAAGSNYCILGDGRTVSETWKWANCVDNGIALLLNCNVPDTTYKKGTNAETVCTPKKIGCPPGSYFTATDATQDHTCTPCGINTYKMDPGLVGKTYCDAKTLTCGAGEYFTATDDKTIDNTCTGCDVRNTESNKAFFASCTQNKTFPLAVTSYKTGTNAETACQAKTLDCSAQYDRGLYFTATSTAGDNTCTRACSERTTYEEDSNRICKPKTLECGPGKYLTATDATQDNTCTGCGDNTFKSGCDAVTACTQYKTLQCGAGEYFEATDKTQDNTCTGCGDNTYKEASDAATVCGNSKTLECAAGSYFTATDKMQDNTCTSCGDNEYKEGSNALTACQSKTTTECAAGLYFTATDKTQDNTCTSCGANTYKEASDAATVCKPKTLECAAGSYFTATDKTQDNTCTSCGANEYKEGLNTLTVCTPKTLVCAAGSYFTATDKMQDNTCTSCGDNEYKEGSNALTACQSKTTTECAAGLYFTATDKTQDNTCNSCGANTYKEASDAATVCKPKTLECAAGSYFTATGKTQENTCTPCGDNEYKAGLNDETACTAKTMVCGPGSYFTATGNTMDNSCTDCPDGEFKTGNSVWTGCFLKASASSCASGETFVPGVDSQKTKDDTDCGKAFALTGRGKITSSTLLFSRRGLTQVQCGEFCRKVVHMNAAANPTRAVCNAYSFKPSGLKKTGPCNAGSTLSTAGGMVARSNYHKSFYFYDTIKNATIEERITLPAVGYHNVTINWGKGTEAQCANQCSCNPEEASSASWCSSQGKCTEFKWDPATRLCQLFAPTPPTATASCTGLDWYKEPILKRRGVYRNNVGTILYQTNPSFTPADCADRCTNTTGCAQFAYQAHSTTNPLICVLYGTTGLGGDNAAGQLFDLFQKRESCEENVITPAQSTVKPTAKPTSTPATASCTGLDWYKEPILKRRGVYRNNVGTIAYQTNPSFTPADCADRCTNTTGCAQFAYQAHSTTNPNICVLYGTTELGGDNAAGQLFDVFQKRESCEENVTTPAQSTVKPTAKPTSTPATASCTGLDWYKEPILKRRGVYRNNVGTIAYQTNPSFTPADCADRCTNTTGCAQFAYQAYSTTNTNICVLYGTTELGGDNAAGQLFDVFQQRESCEKNVITPANSYSETPCPSGPLSNFLLPVSDRSGRYGGKEWPSTPPLPPMFLPVHPHFSFYGVVSLSLLGVHHPPCQYRTTF